MKPPNSRKLKAQEDRMPLGGPMLRVTGEVETNNGRIVPTLTDTVPPGINPSILLLDLTLVDSGGVGTDDVQYRPIKKYEKTVSRGQYTTVEIRWEGKPIATLEVEVTH